MAIRRYECLFCQTFFAAAEPDGGGLPACPDCGEQAVLCPAGQPPRRKGTRSGNSNPRGKPVQQSGPPSAEQALTEHAKSASTAPFLELLRSAGLPNLPRNPAQGGEPAPAEPVAAPAEASSKRISGKRNLVPLEPTPAPPHPTGTPEAPRTAGRNAARVRMSAVAHDSLEIPGLRDDPNDLLELSLDHTETVPPVPDLIALSYEPVALPSSATVTPPRGTEMPALPGELEVDDSDVCGVLEASAARPGPDGDLDITPVAPDIPAPTALTATAELLEVKRLLEAVPPLLWGLEQAAAYLQATCVGPEKEVHARQLQLLHKVLTRLKDHVQRK